MFAALGDTTRLQLVTRLSSEGPLSVTRLCEGADVSRQAVSKHLDVLDGAGLVRSVRSGRERIWELDAMRLQAARACLEQVSAAWDQAILRLKAFVEEDEES